MADENELTEEIKQQIEADYNRYSELREYSINNCYTYYKDGVVLTNNMDLHENGVYGEDYDRVVHSNSQECQDLDKEMDEVWWRYLRPSVKYRYWADDDGVWRVHPVNEGGGSGDDSYYTLYDVGEYIPEITEGELVPNIKEIFEEIFKDFTYDNANMAGGEALLSREEVETASYWKVAAIGKIDECKFAGNSGLKILEGIEEDFETLDEAKAYLDAQSKYLSDGNGIKNQIVEALKELLEFYKDLTKKYSEIAIYSSKCDYMTHQYYEDENAWTVLENWVPDVQEIMQTAEDAVPEVVTDQTNDLSGVISDIEKVAHKLKDNDAISLIENLRREASYQYLSKYIDYYGSRLAQIIRSIMMGVDNKDYDITLIDELTLIEQKLQQQLTTAASRMTVLNRSVAKYKGIKDFSGTNNDIVTRLREAVTGMTAHNEA